ncbi:NAD(P)-binding protein [Microthyrium microscopicum]|uniref:NAD(P)-binding protein n=1 Tax=Microthyrium microscopicum TaxID=703497 RepID=A0A6A6U7P8_9PEZI|nr:NAD(P)-binding protein [Microthyrium microscopicum]
MSGNTIIAPYSELHKSPNGPGDGRPTALKIVQDEDLVGKWSDKTILITGASSGIGVETARALHATGARIFITSRDMAKADSVVEDIMSTSPSKVPIETLPLDFNSLDSVRSGAQDFLSRSKYLNILINNAGAMSKEEKVVTKDGFESLFQVNYLAPYLLTKMLLPTLVASSTPDFASRVVNVSSMGHIWHSPGGLTDEALADINFEHKPFQPWLQYGQTKTANILHANQIERLYGSDPEHPVHAFSLHPGAITTEIWRYMKDKLSEREQQFKKVWKSVDQGAATSVWCACAKVWEGKKGRYCEECQESVPLAKDAPKGSQGYAPWAYDEVQEKKLWDMSEDLVKKWA